MKSFDEIYKEIYSKNNKELADIKEFNKQVDKKRILTIMVTVIISLAISIIICYLGKNSSNEMAVISTAFGLPVIFILASIPIVKVFLSTSKKEYKTVFKDKVIKELVKCMDNNLEYDLKIFRDTFQKHVSKKIKLINI